MAEAAAQFHKGLDQLALLPDGSERQRREIDLWGSLGAVLMVVKGQGAPETGYAYTRALNLWKQLGSPSEFLGVPYGQSRHHAARGKLHLAQRLDEDLLRLSRERKDTAGLALAHYSSGSNLMFAGRFALSRSHLEEVREVCSPTSHSSLVSYAGIHPHTSSQAFLGIVQFCLGFPDRALARSSMAIAEARGLAHPPTLALSLAYRAILLSLVGDYRTLAQVASNLVELATEQNFPVYRGVGTLFQGCAEVTAGNTVEGMSLLRNSLIAYRASGINAWMPYHIALLVNACEISGQIEEAEKLLDEASQVIERTGERLLEAELRRHKGELLLRQGHSTAAEELYRKALCIALEQEAKLWELRAAVSLARLWGDQGRRAEARDLLAPVYRWFTEGFDTPDLREAKALLDELT
jgi:predicted ATPase